ncbi:MAG: hypothetical protein RLY21_2138 [Planctomycetota bacterium]|jgi:predicted peptidase
MRTIGFPACALALSLSAAVSAQDQPKPTDAAPAPAITAAPNAAPREIAREIPQGQTVVKSTDGSADATYRYRLVEPSAEAIAKADGKLPLIVFLHGSGERGGDNTAQLKHFVGWTATEEFQSKAPCFVLAVQCPADESWTPYDLKAFKERGEFPKMQPEPTRAMRAVMQAMDEVIATKPIDRSRIYLTGLSMGGFGAFELAARRPDFFAAVASICGGGDLSTAPVLARTPNFIVSSNYDPVVPNELSRKMAFEISNAMQRAWQAARARAASANPPKPIPPRVGNPAYREYDGAGHESWTPAYRFGPDGILDWMFGKRRETPAPAPNSPKSP